LEKINFSTLGETKAEQRRKDLTALERELAAHGLGFSGARLKCEMDIVFQGFESLIEAAIAYRKELATKVPELLFPVHLKDFQVKLEHYVDIAIGVLERRYYENPAIKMLPRVSVDAAIKRATMRADVLKGRFNNQMRAMALEGSLGMHREDQSQVSLNISNSQITNLNLGSVVGDLNGSIQILTTAGQTKLAMQCAN
jgi:hypothetical protein